jgi:hypothetical protein
LISTTEAKFANLTPAALSAKCVARALEECGAPQLKPMILFTDSLNAHFTAMNTRWVHIHTYVSTRCAPEKSAFGTSGLVKKGRGSSWKFGTYKVGMPTDDSPR